MTEESLHVVPTDVPYFLLDVARAFATITPQQRLYAHHMNTAAWLGLQVVSAQISHESPAIGRLFAELFDKNSVDSLRQAAAAQGVSSDAFDGFVEYAAYVYVNRGNYSSFGDKKFVPRCTPEAFRSIVSHAPVGAAELTAQLDAVASKIYSLSVKERFLSYDCTSYYGGDVTAEEVARVAAWCKGRFLSDNTRIFKTAPNTFELRIASADVRREAPVTLDDEHKTTITVVYGDHSEQMGRVAASLEAAIPFAANDIQKATLREYVAAFRSGSMESYKASQRLWVQDKNPDVECCIGFVENYRDPSGARCEFEGFTAVVDKEESTMYGNLVDSAQRILPRLPWGASFEREAFHRPDFTSLQVVGFVCSGVPAGINIPNFDDIRNEVGFKNVYLSNSVSAYNKNAKPSVFTDEDWDVVKVLFPVATSINVAIHELLGHGSGKLLTENADGTFNFDREKVIDPFTNKPVASWWKPGETWGALFGRLSTPYEECRAEAAALYLCLDADTLAIFGVVEPAYQRSAVHVLWLGMMRAALFGLEQYSPEQEIWAQAHMRARFAILQVLLRHGNGVLTVTGEGTDAMKLHIDADRIHTDGKKAVGDLLLHLQVYKSTANVVEAQKYFGDLTVVDERALKMRESVMMTRKPRRQFVQVHSRLNADGTDVEIVSFPPSPYGVIESMVTRHKEIPL